MLKPKPKKQQQSALPATLPGLFFERMEPKILMSADALSGLVTSDPFSNDDTAGLSLHASVDLINDTYSVENASLDNLNAVSIESFSLDILGGLLDSANNQTLRQEIIFVDAATPDYQQLIDGLQTDTGTQYQVFILQSNQDGIEQISETLEGLYNIDAIHLVSHGSEGGIQLGESWLGEGSLDARSAAISAWSTSLSETADVLIYGCNLAADISGQQLINQLADLTGADVAASDDLTGAGSLGGDWELEYRAGNIETGIAFTAQLQQSWNATLDLSNPLWLTTDNDVSGGGQALGINSWDKGDLVQIADPSLQLEQAGTTSGTFSEAFDGEFYAPGVNVNGAHYVSADIQLGASNFQLLAGDLLLTGDDALWSGNSASPDAGFNNLLIASKDDVLVFRPDIPGDYSKGSFALLLDIPAGTELTGITLIEQDTTVGDASLNAGDFLFTRTGGQEGNDVWLYQVTDVGVFNTSGIASVLIEGNEVGINKLNGIDLVETTTTIGGTTLTSGTLLLTSISGQAGDNALAIEKYDVYALDVTATTLVAGAGNAAATASLVFDGSDVAFDAGAEQLDGLTLTVTNEQAPVVTTTLATPLIYTTLDPASVIDPSVTITDSDSTDMAGGSLTVSISSGVTVNDTLSILVGGNVTLSGADVLVSGITIGTIDAVNNGVNGTDLVINWNVNSSPASIQQVLQQVAYNNTSGTPDTSTRIVDFVVDDGDGAVSAIAQQSINYTSVSAPVITLPGGVVSFTENAAVPVIIDASATVSDSDSSDFDTGTLTVSISVNASTGDILGINVGGNITLSGLDVLYGSNVIGTIDAVNNGTVGNPLIITWSGVNATPAAVQEVLRQLAFSDSSEDPSTLIRTVSFKLTDGDGGASLAVDHQVNVIAVNDAPSGADNTIVTAEDVNYVFATADFGFSDPLDNDTFSAVRVASLPSLGVLTNNGAVVTAGDLISVSDIDLGLFTYTPPLNGVGVALADFDFQVQDSGGTTNGGVNLATANTMSITVSAQNDAPTATNLNASVSYSPGDVAVDLNDIVITDVDSGEIVTASLILADVNVGVLSANDGASYNPATGEWTITGSVANVNIALANLSFTPLIANLQSTTIGVSIDDGDEDNSGPLLGTLSLTVNSFTVIDEVVDQSSTNVSEEAVVTSATEVEPESEASETTVKEIIADAEIGSIAVDGGAPDFNTAALQDVTVTDDAANNAVARPTNNNHTTEKENAAGNNAGDDAALDRVRQEIAFLKDPLHLIGADSLLTKLNDMREELIMEKQDTAKVVGGSLTISAGLSIGYVVWLAKSGAVMSSMLATLPAWRFIDPMPVLMSMQYQDADEDEESLESMVEDKELDQETLAEEKPHDA